MMILRREAIAENELQESSNLKAQIASDQKSAAQGPPCHWPCSPSVKLLPHESSARGTAFRARSFHEFHREGCFVLRTSGFGQWQYACIVEQPCARNKCFFRHCA